MIPDNYRGVPTLVNDVGKLDEVLPGGADRQHADSLILLFIADLFSALGSEGPPQIPGIANLDLTIINPEINRL